MIVNHIALLSWVPIFGYHRAFRAVIPLTPADPQGYLLVSYLGRSRQAHLQEFLAR